MEKRYQVFISSTFQDLQNARQEVSQALLRADCFPAGMELFPAADEEQFEFIKTIIDQSDYYILISAGRYGSIHPETGLSYTEMEYDYAVKIGKPIIRLLHRDPFNELKGEFIEKTAKGRKALEKFRTKLCDRRMVKFWKNELELGTAVDHGLRHLIKTKPSVGWVKADQSTLNATIGTNLQRGLTATTRFESDNKYAKFLDQLSGSVSVQRYALYERELPLLEVNRFRQKQSDEVVEISHKFNRYNYAPAKEPEKWDVRKVLYSICLGLLSTDSFSEAKKVGLSSNEEIGKPGSTLFLIDSDREVEGCFMALEASGYISQGQAYTTSSQALFTNSPYLHQNAWKLEKGFRRWLLTQLSSENHSVSTPHPSAP